MALRNSEGIALIQGPPGTGKTSTLRMLLGAHFAAHPRGVRKATLDLGLDEVNPNAVLLCAPSNAAVDEMLRRIDRDGVPTKTKTLLKVSLKMSGRKAKSGNSICDSCKTLNFMSLSCWVAVESAAVGQFEQGRQVCAALDAGRASEEAGE